MGETDEERETLINPPCVKPKGVFGTRHVIGVMGFLGITIVTTMMASLPVVIVAMVNSSAIPHINESSPDACPVPSTNSSNAYMKDGEFAWDENEQGLILSAVYWGYLVTSLIAGRLGELFGGKIVFGFGVLVTSVVTLTTPVMALTSTTLFIASRVAVGLGQGFTIPSMNAVIARWIPPLESSKMVSLVISGMQSGTAVGMAVSGVLCQSNFLGGWPSTFYVFGVLGILFCVAWSYLVYSDPEEHPRISLDEKLHIQHSLQQSRLDKTLPIPIRSVLTSMPFWAVLVAHILGNFSGIILMTALPTYMKNMLHFDIANNSFLSALPFLLMCLFGLVAGQLADRLRSTGVLSTTATRRLFNSIGAFGSTVCLILVGFTGCNKTFAVVLFCTGLGLKGAAYSGMYSSHVDIAPNFAGTLVGITTSAATIASILAPMTVGALINGRQTVERWRVVFMLSAIVSFVSNTFYIIFVSGEVQPWNSSSAGTCSSNREQQGENGGQSPAGQYQTFAASEETLEDSGDEGEHWATTSLPGISYVR